MASYADFGDTVFTAEGEFVTDDIVGSIECITFVSTDALKRKGKINKNIFILMGMKIV